MKRILLFILTNVAVVAVLGIVASLLGVNRFLTSNGLNLSALLGFALIMGFGGAIISLLISKPVAKWSAGVRLINEPQNADEAWIVETVRRLADKAQIGMPEVGIFEGEPNAFATGAFKNSSLVAVSTGLLQGMTKEEIEAVLGHEIAHVANGDMVTMTLIQGVMNTFVVFLSRVIGYAVDGLLRKEGEAPVPASATTSAPSCSTSCSGLPLPSLWPGSRATASSAPTRARRNCMGRKQPMMNALARLGGMQPGELPKAVEAMGITGSIGKLFATHPPIEERIAALQNAQA